MILFCVARASSVNSTFVSTRGQLEVGHACEQEVTGKIKVSSGSRKRLNPSGLLGKRRVVARAGRAPKLLRMGSEQAHGNSSENISIVAM